MREFIFEVQVTGYYFKDLITQRTSSCCSAHFIYNKGVIDPKTNRYKIKRVCSYCFKVE